jgi:glycosyltransferase involved in cell wall biosynthesis
VSGAIVYVAHEFPARSQTFVVAEAEALAVKGFDVQIYALRPGREAVSDSRILTWRVALRRATAPLLWGVLRRAYNQRQFVFRQFCLPPGTVRRRLKFGKAFLHAVVLAMAVASDGRCVHLRAHFFGLMSEVALLTRAMLPAGSSVSIAGHAADVARPESVDRLLRESESADFVTGASTYVLDQLDRHGSRARAVLVRCGVPLRDAPATLLASAVPLRVLSVGRLVEKKGFDDCLRSCREADPDSAGILRWQIVGDGPERAHLARLVTELSLSRSVELIGEKCNEEVLGLLSTACDVFVLPSRIARDGDADGIPVALMEAMSMGIPVITTAVGGIPELVVDGVTGVVVGQNQPSEIAVALRRMLADRQWARQLGLRGQAHVRASFRLDDQASALAEMVRGVGVR